MKTIKQFTKDVYFEFEGGCIFTVEDVYKEVKNHSRLIDRLNPRKMALMTLDAFDLLNGAIDDSDKNPDWMFFSGKKGRVYK